MDANFPSNAKNPVAPKSEKEIEKVVQGTVITQRPTFWRRLKDTLTENTGGSVFEYVVFDVMVPAAKDMFADAVSQGVERLIFGGSRISRRSGGYRPYGTSTHTNYTRYSQPGTNPIGSSRYSRDRVETPRSIRIAQEFDDIILPTRAEADTVLERMYDLLTQYESVSVADLYELVGLSPSHIDHKWGWIQLNGARHRRIREGYILELPKPIALDE